MSASGGRDGVLVLDGNSQAALTVIRSLGQRGVSVTAGGPAPRSLGMLSRYSEGTYVYPDPEQDHEAFVAHLIDHLDQSDYVAVFAVEDALSLVLSRYKERIESTGTTVACEDWETFRRAYDKGTLFELLAPLDVPTPDTYSPSSLSEVAELSGDIEYPVVVKPRSKSHLMEDDGYAVTRVADENYAASPAELQSTYRRIVRRRDQLREKYPLVQEYVPGTTTTTVALADDGDVVTYFQEKRLRTYPSSGGNSALLTGVDEPTMLTYTGRVLDRLDWTGPVMVEFMETPSGEFYVIEVNGRYWGSLPFAVESGVDFPWLYYLQLRGIDPSPYVDYGDYRTDFVQRRLLYEDIQWFCENISEGNVGAVVPFLGAFRRARHTFVALDDPVPTVGALVRTTQLAVQSVTQRLSG